jgi:DNA-binding response OmpR family regulator
MRDEYAWKHAMVKLLLLEDDPVSASFLSEVLQAFPAAVDCVGSCAAAETAARAGNHTLWLFDANLPDGNGADLLQRLRASGSTTPAVALTAESARERLESLANAGFVDVLQKPIAGQALIAAVRKRLNFVAEAEAIPTVAILWDETRALAAVGGRSESARALRELFLGELPAQVEQIRAAFSASDHAEVRAQLHRLKASCGFVGAAGLLGAVGRLSERMDQPSLRDFLDLAARQLRSVTVSADLA